MQCPICKKPITEPPPLSPNRGQRSYFPFCSERCKLIDLGRWLGGRYQIPVERSSDKEEFTSPTVEEEQDGPRGSRQKRPK